MRFFGRNTKTEVQSGNCYALFRSRFPKDLSATFIECESGARYSFSDLDNISGRFARLFEQCGLSPGDRVVIQVEKSPETIFLYIACLRFGAFFVPLERSLQRREVEYILHDAMPALIVCRPENETMFSELAHEVGGPFVRTLGQSASGSLMEESAYLPPLSRVHSAASNDVACILYTSGTTGRPKGAMLTHGNLVSNTIARHGAWRIDRDDVLLHVQDISHVSGLNAVNSCLYAPCKMVFLIGFGVNAIIRHLPEATIFMGGPWTYSQLLDSKKLTRSLCKNVRLCIFLTAALPKEIYERFFDITGKTIIDRYGMTETGVNTCNPIERGRVGSCGTPLPGIEVRITDEVGNAVGIDAVGNVEVRGPNIFKGYWKDPEKTRESFRPDGFFVTGDLGKLDEDEYLWIVGRTKDAIKFQGANVYPKEVELYIDTIDGVEESAVFGIPHPEFGECVAAAVKRRPGAHDLTENSIIAALKGEIAHYKVPRRIYFLKEIPHNEMGKIQKNVLREEYKNTFVDT